MGMSMGLSGQGPGSQRAVSEINVTPLVDIMLVLLVIFMVTAPMMNQGVDVQLPSADSKPMSSEKEPLVVSVKADGSTYIEDKLVSDAELATKISAVKKNSPDLVVYVRGDRKADYGVIMGVMAKLQSAGIERIGLVSEPR